MSSSTRTVGALEDERWAHEMMDGINKPRRGPSIALAWLAFVLAGAGCALTFLPWVGMTLAVSKGVGPADMAAFGFWGDPIMIGSLVAVPATLVVAIVSIFKPIGRRLQFAAFVMALFWPLAMQVLRTFIYK